MDFADLVTTSPRYNAAIGQTTVEGFVGALKQGGYMTDPNYVQKISGIATRYASVIRESTGTAGSLPGARVQSGVTVPNQFAIGLPASEALAACGPVAAMAFAQVYGRTPTAQEAMELAKQSGWSAGGGMNGIANEARLLESAELG
jgi:hypothetical protein